METSRGVLLIGPRSLDDRSAHDMREQARRFVELNRRKCSFILLPDLPGTAPEVCNALPDWLEIILLTPESWIRGSRWEGKHYDNVLELPMRKGYYYARGFGDDDSYFARRSYRFGIDWIAPWGVLLAFRNERAPCRDVEGALHYARTQQVSVVTRSIS